MATSTKKPAKKKAPQSKSSKKPAKTRSKARTVGAPPAGLTVEDKQRLLKPGSNYDSVIADAVAAWKANGRYVKVPDLSAAKLGSQAKRAIRAATKERELRAKMDAKLQPLMDARMRAEDLVMRGMLDLNAEVKSSARRRPELTDAFASLAAFCARGGRSSGGNATDDPAAPSG